MKYFQHISTEEYVEIHNQCYLVYSIKGTLLVVGWYISSVRNSESVKSCEGEESEPVNHMKNWRNGH